jgi:hypothetical protein
MGGKRYDLGRFSNGKGIRYALFRGFGGSMGRSGRGQKILPLLGLDPRNFQLIAIRYTDHAILAPAVMMNITAFRGVWSCNLVDTDLRFGRMYCLHKMVQDNRVRTQLVEYLLQRQHVSALALGHHQVSNCGSEETIQCSIRLAYIIQRDLIDNVTIDNCQEKLVINEISLDNMS